MESNGIKKRAVKRKSYKYGRRCSRSLGSVISTDFADIIDKALIPEKRLKKLFEVSLQNAFHIAEREISTKIDSNKFEEVSNDCIASIEKCAEEQDVYSLAINSDESFTSQQSFYDNLEVFNKELAKLDKECFTWKQLILKESEELKRVKKETPCITLDPVPTCEELKPYDYSGLSQKYLKATNNYFAMIETLNNLNTKLNETADSTCRFADFLKEEAESNLN